MNSNESLNTEQLALIFGINEKTIIMLAKENEIPCEYHRRKPYFKINKLIKHFEILEGGAA